jgi:hypothetical protein
MTNEEAAWLAGIIEGEGSIGVSCHETSRGFAAKGRITISNQDADLVTRSAQLITALVGEEPLIRVVQTRGFSNKPLFVLFVQKRISTILVLSTIYPYLVGAKKNKALLVMKFLYSREMTLQGSVRGRAGYTRGELEMLLKFQQEQPAKGARKSQHVLNLISGALVERKE